GGELCLGRKAIVRFSIAQDFDDLLIIKNSILRFDAVEQGSPSIRSILKSLCNWCPLSVTPKSEIRSSISKSIPNEFVVLSVYLKINIKSFFFLTLFKYPYFSVSFNRSNAVFSIRSFLVTKYEENR